MEQHFWSDPLKCSACEEELPSGSIIYIVCVQCAQIYFGVDDPKQLTLFEIEGPKEVH